MSINFGSPYLTDHLITYLGNKRRLLNFVNSTIDEVKTYLGNSHPSMLDGFSGSGAVARLFKLYAGSLWVNDLEGYSRTLNACYLANPSEIDAKVVCEQIDDLNRRKLDPQTPGFIETHYAPKDDHHIKHGERVFYTKNNARIIDNIRRMIDEVDPSVRDFVLAPLLIEASIHTNTSGVFKGFHKKDGVGHFGGAGENAISRITAEISLEYPIWCYRECLVNVVQGDINEVIRDIPELDIVYYDPPYNQHPYGSNYFMLNLIDRYDQPEIQDGVSGITKEWNRSLYNKRQEAEAAMDGLLEQTKAKFIIISYNNEGIIPIGRFEELLQKHGEVSLKEQSYHTYRGSKNLGKSKTLKDGKIRPLRVNELLWVVRKF